MKLCLFILYTLISILAFGQYSDIREYGFNGKIKKVTIYTYDSLNPEVKKGTIIHKGNWQFKEIREYDEKGLFQKGKKFDNASRDTNTIFSVSSVVNYTKSGKTVIEYESGGLVFDSVKYTWTSDSSYHLVYYDNNGKIRTTSENWLTSFYRDKAGHSFIFSSNGQKVQEFRYVNTFNRNNRVVSSKRTDLFKKTFKTTLLQELQFDDHGNPAEIRLTFSGSSHPYKISIRYFEYY
jgi:hypothetical protein